MESSTTILRRMLDERGVKYLTDDGESVRLTKWSTPRQGEFMDYALFVEFENGKTDFTFPSSTVTPEQAIAATLERGECERVKHGTKPDGTPRYRCSVCGYGLGDYRWAYCPKCGRKVRKAVKR